MESDGVAVGSVADPLESVVRHKTRTAKISDDNLSVRVHASLPSPVAEPLSMYFVVFVGDGVLRF